MKKISISPIVKGKCPALRLGCMSCTVRVFPSGPRLQEVISGALQEIHREVIENVSRLPGIASAKKAYRALGKDPSRYRPSAEALTRRVVKGKGLYHVNNVVDILNLVSVQSGFSIGGYDEKKIAGSIVMRTGSSGEPYTAIGRGTLNIENLPVLQDVKGVFGSPTSDSMRTMVTDDTHHFLMVFFDFGSETHLEPVLEDCKMLLREFAGAGHFEMQIIS